jgi:hypothetical protein
LLARILPEPAQALASRATTPATLRAYKADWTHSVGAYLACLVESHAQRRSSVIGKLHRFNDLP